MSELILPSGVTRRQIGDSKFEYSLFPSTSVVQKSDMGAPMIRTSDSGKVYRFRNQRFWAHGGRIYIVDEAKDEFTSCSIEDFGQRAVGMIQQATALIRWGHWGDERKELVDAIGDMKRAIYDAKEQGDPHDPNVLAFKLRQRGRRASVGYTASSATVRKNKQGQLISGKVVGRHRPRLQCFE